jgi:DNA replication and repair protein RecF
MQILSLSLSNFRVFARLEIEFGQGLTLLYGKNAQGKTTILEAINFLSILTSPIAGFDRELINFLCLNESQPVSRLVAEIQKKGKTHRMEVRLILDPVSNGSTRLRKEVLIDGVKRRLFDTVGFFNSVIFLPQMTRIIEDGPEDRRRYLDQTLSQAYPGYMKALSKYQTGIVKRNALLKQIFEKQGDKDQLLYWDQLIAENGATLIFFRNQAIQELGKLAQQKHSDLTKGIETLEMIYQPSFNPWNCDREQLGLTPSVNFETPLTCDGIKNKFQKALSDLWTEEIQRGMTTIGPHRDELIVNINTINLATFGSRGQIRTAVMSLKFAELDWIKEKSGEPPVFLLDETLVELDLYRRNDLLKMLENGGQAILTTADLELFSEEFIQRCTCLKIENGKIS